MVIRFLFYEAREQCFIEESNLRMLSVSGVERPASQFVHPPPRVHPRVHLVVLHLLRREHRLVVHYAPEI